MRSDARQGDKMLKAILVLPFNVLITIPFIILYFCGFELLEAKAGIVFGAMIILFLSGLGLMSWTIFLFAHIGKGSLAPWNPTQKLITTGPYAYVRNPMLTGVFLVLLGEALLFQSMALFWYLVIFMVINAVYFPLSEEKGLVKRFGAEYEVYKRNVPRFIPRLRPWKNKK